MEIIKLFIKWGKNATVAIDTILINLRSLENLDNHMSRLF